MTFAIDASLLLYPNWSGVQVYTYNVLREMLRQSAGRHAFRLLCDRTTPEERLDALTDGANVTRHSRPNHYAYHALLPLDVLRLRGDVYYSFSGRIKTPLSCPVVLTLHDLGSHVLPDHYGVADPEGARRAAAKALKGVDGIVTVSETVREEMVSLFGLDPKRILVAPNAVDEATVSGPGRRPAALPDGDLPFFLMVNPGRSYKNWRAALEAFRCYLADDAASRDVRLVLAGDLRDETDSIRETLERSPALKERVCLLGYIDDAELRYLYRNARLLLIPSLYEGFGIPTIEAMAFDLPVVASDIPVFREVVGDAGVRAPADDPQALAAALRAVDTDADLRETLIGRGRERVRDFSWADSAGRTLEFLERLSRTKAG